MAIDGVYQFLYGAYSRLTGDRYKPVFRFLDKNGKIREIDLDVFNDFESMATKYQGLKAKDEDFYKSNIPHPKILSPYLLDAWDKYLNRKQEKAVAGKDEKEMPSDTRSGSKTLDAAPEMTFKEAADEINKFKKLVEKYDVLDKEGNRKPGEEEYKMAWYARDLMSYLRYYGSRLNAQRRETSEYLELYKVQEGKIEKAIKKSLGDYRIVGPLAAGISYLTYRLVSEAPSGISTSIAPVVAAAMFFLSVFLPAKYAITKEEERIRLSNKMRVKDMTIFVQAQLDAYSLAHKVWPNLVEDVDIDGGTEKKAAQGSG